MICKHFGVCGGCAYWAVRYEEELAQKEEEIKKLFSFLNLPSFPILPSPKSLHYRNKMEFTFRENLNHERYLGLLAKRNRVVTLDECLICPPWFIEVKKLIFDWWVQEGIEAYFAPKNIGILRNLTLREGLRTGQKMIILTISGNGEFLWEESLLFSLSNILKEGDTVVIRRQITQKKVPTRFEEKILFGKGFIEEQLQTKEGTFLRFAIKPASFFQPNTLQAEILYKRALELGNLKPEDVLYDLYCGTGTIGIMASSYVNRVYGIENNLDAVSDAHVNLKNNTINNVQMLCCGVEEGRFAEKPSCVIVDPPRVGLSEKAMKQVLSLNSKKIIYISCNPKSQAQNVKTFIENGYQVQAIQPVDQFPHTPHVENIIVLVSVV